MITRVTTQMSMAAASARLQAGAARVAELTDQATTLRAIQKPSDDPVGTASSMQVRKEQAAAAQHSRNANDAAAWLATTDSALSGVYSVLNNVRDLTVRAANSGTMSDTDRDAFVTQFRSLKADLEARANATYGTRSVFAGSSTAAVAYDPATGWAASGTDVSRRVGDGTTVRVDTTGTAVFGSGDDSVFGMIDSIVSDLQNGVNVNARIGDVDTALGTVRGAQADVGVRHAAALAAQDSLKSATVSLESRRADIEDVDLAKAVLDLQVQQTNYQAALAVTAKVLQPTLMDYLR
ncbi:flagellin N-terminal helical domain-containing protein [Curtobacterium flaccumfaciens]|uniref:flagellin N-terminal helical domain-containing protein n=1 Tax=Curtobacterium flaccumfaciens TaxID=2035 RepID=UPI001BDE7ED6|nr:flagellin [Curtobacterium flaccumfaciens]MBT1606984.1 flagellar hook-associated protein 3 [Curtobacterium flaccumfaciens pv. betae]MBT1655112.1 flagellar hook-associated protein 3 [Curtobacterium flaccumfaciens pv. betae]MCS0469809.1 flagellar hook-associated protein 3 [Curtobacterium flaccumfaciens pv. betae]MCS0472975.1 flagellar hook-associated protein 3 [Curtobacterium flaccumfaciens pv. betae]MCS0476657.1 flagellar hook-associated protein 3 [Curtobacterium flaccumfaciens pv. betae]